MTRAPYQPQPGTIPARAIAHLRTLAPGAELPTAQLCEEIGTVDNGFHSCMRPALLADLVRVGKKTGSRFAFWSLGHGTPAPDPEHEPDEDEPPKPSKPSAWSMPPRSVFDLARASFGGEKPEVDDPPAPVATKPANVLGWTPAPPAAGPVDPVGAEEMADAVSASSAAAPAPADDNREPEPFICALWSDGRLQLHRGDAELALLSADETRALLRYLDRITDAEDRA